MEYETINKFPYVLGKCPDFNPMKNFNWEKVTFFLIGKSKHGITLGS